MATPESKINWILLGATVVRKEDIRRIDMSTQFGLIFNVYFQYGPPIRIQLSDHGAQWLYECYLDGREGSTVESSTVPASSDTE